MNSQDNINCVILSARLAYFGKFKSLYLQVVFWNVFLIHGDSLHQRKQDLQISWLLGLGSQCIILIFLLKYEMAT